MDLDYRLYLVTDSRLPGGYERVPAVVAEAIAGGVSVVQVRDKELDDDTFAHLARAVEKVARPHGVPVLVNDRVEIAVELGLGVHVGQQDMALDEVRALVGEAVPVGLSVSNTAELEAIEACQTRPDYVGLSPLCETPTKTDTAAALGYEGTRRLAARAHVMGLAAVAIGGINHDNIRQARATGVDGVCVVSAIMAAADPRAAARQLLKEC